MPTNPVPTKAADGFLARVETISQKLPDSFDTPLAQTAWHLFKTVFNPDKPSTTNKIAQPILHRASLAAVQAAGMTFMASMEAKTAARAEGWDTPGPQDPTSDPNVRKHSEYCNILNAALASLGVGKQTFDGCSKESLDITTLSSTTPDQDKIMLRMRVADLISKKTEVVTDITGYLTHKRDLAVEELAKALQKSRNTAHS